jgi:hypothetical protein
LELPFFFYFHLLDSKQLLMLDISITSLHPPRSFFILNDKKGRSRIE